MRPRRIVFVMLGAAVVIGLAVAGLFLTTRTAESQVGTKMPHSVLANAASEATEIDVYVISRGGKFIGDDVGGAQVTIRDARTGEFLASGVTRGGSGAADLMTVERARTTPLSTEGAAAFTMTLTLDQPRLLEIQAYGPLGGQSSANRVSATQWAVPQAFGENKFIIEIPGLNVDVLNPPTHFMPTTKPPLEIPLRANVTMMCGCPIGPATAWQPQNYSVKAVITKPDGTQDMVDLQFDANAPGNAPSQFIGTYTATQAGVYQAYVYAQQRGTDNAGSDFFTFIVQ